MLRSTVTSPLFDSIREASASLRAGSVSCAELVRACLERIAEVQPVLNPFITVTAEGACDLAKTLDEELAAGKDRGPLHGIPIVHKDLFDTAGVRTTAGARLYGSRIPVRNATVVQRLADAGAVMLGKTNMNELAAGTSGKNVHYGDVRNPWNPERSAGGSSSGTAAAIAAGLCLAGTGSDTGGSIRIPAACNALVALRPGFGRLPLEGVTLRSRSLDTVGPMARTAGDCALLFGAMAGAAVPLLSSNHFEKLKIGIPVGLERLLEPEIGTAFHAALDLAVKRGAQLHTVRIPGLFEATLLEGLMDVMLFEFHDLLRSEYRAAASPEKLFGPVVLANLRRGARITAVRYEACLKLCRTLAKAVRRALQKAEVLALPVLSAPTPLLEAPPAVYDRQRELTLPLSATGLPVVSIPCGRDAAGLPLGLQLVGNDAAEEALLGIAAGFEQIVGWPGWRPALR